MPLSRPARPRPSVPSPYLLRLVPFGGPERQRLVPLAFYAPMLPLSTTGSVSR